MTMSKDNVNETMLCNYIQVVSGRASRPRTGGKVRVVESVCRAVVLSCVYSRTVGERPVARRAAAVCDPRPARTSVMVMS